MYDLEGRAIKIGDIASDSLETNIDLSQVRSALYIIQLAKEGEVVHIEKLIKTD
ncbi:MAG: hypothetical protein ACKO5W_01335 [Crocinitomicaceae bacterium]